MCQFKGHLTCHSQTYVSHGMGSRQLCFFLPLEHGRPMLSGKITSMVSPRHFAWSASSQTTSVAHLLHIPHNHLVSASFVSEYSFTLDRSTLREHCKLTPIVRARVIGGSIHNPLKVRVEFLDLQRLQLHYSRWAGRLNFGYIQCGQSSGH